MVRHVSAQAAEANVHMKTKYCQASSRGIVKQAAEAAEAICKQQRLTYIYTNGDCILSMVEFESGIPGF